MDDEFKHFSECGKIAVSDWVTKFTKYDKNEIEVLDLSENLLSDKSVKLLTQFISECPNLKYIDLSFNRLRQESWMYILQILQNENIQFINFIGNFGIFYENKHKEAFSQIDINLVKKMIWIHKHNLNLEDLSTIIENPDMEDLIYNTHRLFFDHFL